MTLQCSNFDAPESGPGREEACRLPRTRGRSPSESCKLVEVDEAALAIAIRRQGRGHVVYTGFVPGTGE
jgi:hypothetical protein